MYSHINVEVHNDRTASSFMLSSYIQQYIYSNKASRGCSFSMRGDDSGDMDHRDGWRLDVGMPMGVDILRKVLL